MSFLQLVLSLDKTIKEIILLWRICQFDRYRNRAVDDFKHLICGNVRRIFLQEPAHQGKQGETIHPTFAFFSHMEGLSGFPLFRTDKIP